MKIYMNYINNILLSQIFKKNVKKWIWYQNCVGIEINVEKKNGKYSQLYLQANERKWKGDTGRTSDTGQQTNLLNIK
jgi:hypothetical protein